MSGKKANLDGATIAAAAPPVSAATAYSIRVVASQTGIPVDTLRIWERRYGFPKPARRPGGGRLYNIEDVARLRLIARARDAGYRPGDVIALPDRDIARLIDGGSGGGGAGAGASASSSASPSSAAATEPATSVEDLIKLIREDEVAKIRSSLRSLAVTLGPTSFITEIAHPLAVRIGLAWEKGEIDVRHEHLASALLSMQLRLMLSTFEDAEANASSPLILLTTLPGEAHALGLEMVAVYLAARHRATPRLLGADTPTAEIARAADSMKASVVGISVSSAHAAGTMKQHVDALRHALGERHTLWVGGAGAPFVVDSETTSMTMKLTTSWKAIDDAMLALN